MNKFTGDHVRPRPRPVAPEHEDALKDIAEAVSRVNEAILRAVNAGVTVEMIRAARCHDGRGNWGDQMAPAVHDSCRPQN
jgi:hypothetical protein